MNDLRTRLEASLSTTYRLERELGSGGMAVVYLAHDLRHKRRVALKVLRPEISAVIGPERFLREIETLANLTHPHILPLHDSGEADGLLYYVMPYVDGESLRDRLLREKQLPLEDALRIAREVADALSHAHSRGVIHRDIKPENILLLGGHALVADFGIAVAIDLAGGSRLTETGIAIGTPAYMSPEQAVGERTIDARADIYALACVLYEMLAGEPPYTGPTAQMVMTRRLHEPVPSLRNIRELVPEAIDQTITKALARLPADRFATAERFGDALAAPVAAVPIRRRIVEGVQRHTLWQVIGIYALCASIVYLAIVALTNRIGLPAWVPGFAIVLLLIGLPIVVATAFVQQRAPGLRDLGFGRADVADGSRKSDQAHGLALRSRVFLTWRRSLTAGVAAFALLGLITTTYVVLRAASVGPFATLASSGKLSARDPILLADFDAPATDSMIAGTVVEALRIDLEQSPALRTLRPAALELVLRRMGLPASTRIDERLAREIAVRVGLKAVLVGNVRLAGHERVISLRLLSGDSGSVLVALRETTVDSADIISAIDRLSKNLRERAGESLKSLRAARPLEDVTTASLDALMRYSQAWRNFNQNRDREHSIALLREAVMIDPTFAMAYRKLGAELMNDGQRAAAMEPLTRAWELRARGSERERHMIEGSYHHLVEGNYARAADSFQRMIDLYPSDPIARHGRAYALEYVGDFGAAEVEYRRMMVLDSLYLGGIDNLMHEVLPSLGRYDEAEALYQRLMSIAPYGDRPLLGARLASNSGMYDLAAQRYRAVIDQVGIASGVRSTATFELALVLATQGQIRLALRMLADRQSDLDHGVTLPVSFTTALWLTDLRIWVLRQPMEQVRREIDARLAPHKLAGLAWETRPYLAVARLYADLGRPELAKPLVAEWARIMPRTVKTVGTATGMNRDNTQVKLVAEGLIAIAERRHNDAIETFKEADRFQICSVCAKPLLAHAFHSANQPDSAAAMFEKYLSTRSFLRWQIDPVWRAHALEYLAGHYDRAGNADKARLYYAQFIELWKNADPELQPRVQAARRRLEELAVKD